MSARKLQQEMDRVFKRVGEGIVVFNTIYDKVQAATNQSQKEKLEQDLKREIKKLQKLRDQIKTWQGLSEVRDKKQLMEQRKLIEAEMERFKVVEREIKTKAYSQEALNKEKTDDPHWEEKKDTIEFLQAQIEELESQIETLEAEEESLQQSTTKKGKKDSVRSERMAEIDHHLERHKWHISKMETMIHMIENDTLAPESVNELEDDMRYYVESNQEVDFAEDDAIYEDLNLFEDGDDDEIVGTIVRDDTYTLEDLAQDLSKEKEEKAKVVDEPVTPAPVSSGTIAAPAAKTERRTSPANELAKAVSGIQIKDKKSQPDTKSQQPVSHTPPSQQAHQVQTHPLLGSVQHATSANDHPANAVRSSPPAVDRNNAIGAPKIKLDVATAPKALQDLFPQFLATQERLGQSEAATTTIDTAHLLAASYKNCPDSSLADRPKYYHPESPYPTPAYYPSKEIESRENPVIYTKMDVDTLFYIFYYRQGTYQQYLAARELKSRSWRFHKRFLTWFQRYEEPRVINADYEQGTYRFFDFEGSWLQRRKTNFKFEYKFLEDDV